MVVRSDGFSSSRVYYDEDGQICWSTWDVGTSGMEFFDEIVGELTAEEMIKAYRRGVSIMGTKFNEEFSDKIKAAIEKGPTSFFRVKRPALSFPNPNTTPS